MVVRQPLELVEMTEKFDLYITVKGSGSNGQAGAIRHGITRALMEYDEALHMYTAGMRTAKEQQGCKVTKEKGEGNRGVREVKKIREGNKTGKQSSQSTPRRGISDAQESRVRGTEVK